MDAYLLAFLIGVVAGLRVMTAPAAQATPPSQKHLKCHLEVSQVLEASIYRGPPYMVQMLERDPKHADFIMSESHGDHHLACTYKILMNARPYRYKEEFSNTLLDLKESDCESSKVKQAVRERILQFTNRCKDPQAQPTWGYPLESLPP